MVISWTVNLIFAVIICWYSQAGVGIFVKVIFQSLLSSSFFHGSNYSIQLFSVVLDLLLINPLESSVSSLHYPFLGTFPQSYSTCDLWCYLLIRFFYPECIRRDRDWPRNWTPVLLVNSYTGHLILQECNEQVAG